LLGGTIGTIMGIVAGFKGGIYETIIMRLSDVLLAFPDLITGLLVLAVLGRGLPKLIIAIAIVISPRFARLAHGPTLALREKDFVNSARSIGVSDLRMMSHHVLPNIIGFDYGAGLQLAGRWSARCAGSEVAVVGFHQYTTLFTKPLVQLRSTLSIRDFCDHTILNIGR